MILSKLNCGKLASQNGTKRLLLIYVWNPLAVNQTRLFQLNTNVLQSNLSTICSKSPLNVQLNNIRTFKTKNRPYKTHRFGEVASHRAAVFLICFIATIGMIDVEYFFGQFCPQIVRNFFLKIRRFCSNTALKIYNNYGVKRADSLAADKGVSDGEYTEDIDSQTQGKSVMQSVIEHKHITGNENRITSPSFRDKRIIEYENRIRLYSNPDKIFRYFASVKINYRNGDSEIYMTPDDFLRALTPGIKQPDGLGLDQFKKIDIEKCNFDDYSDLLQSLQCSHDKNEFKFNLQPDSIFYKLSKYGLINFSDFLFLLTLLSVSQRHFEIAFRMFDLNGDGEVEYAEFEKVQNAILSQTSIGKKMGTSVRYKGISSAVSRYFFGPDLKLRLTTQTFINFQQSLQYELLTLEFDRKKIAVNTYSNSDEDDRISEIDFADLLVAYANLSEKKRQRMIRRVLKKFSDDNSLGISKVEYLEFFRFLRNINDVDIALSVYNIAGASIDPSTLKHVAHTVANVQLSDHIVNVVFTLFDDNDDGQLSNKEFVAVMKERLRRGLSKPKDTGLFKILYVMWRSIITFEF